MLAGIALGALSGEQKDALILALVAQLEAAQARIAVLEAQVEELTRPPRTPGNSSMPPSRGSKQGGSQPGDAKPARKSRPGVWPALHPNLDRTAPSMPP